MILAASVICRNELSRYLDLNIRHLLGFCDQIRVLDDGSEDGTSEYLTEIHDPRIQVKRLARERTTGNDFHRHAENRNRLMQFTLQTSPNSFVLAIDADEFVDDGQQLRRECERHGPSVLSLTMREAWAGSDGGLTVREDGGWRSHEVSMVWHTSLLPQHQLLIVDRGPATGRTPDGIHRLRSHVTGVTVFHLGWANVSERQGRYDRYMLHDAGNFHARRHLESIMWPDSRIQTSWRPWGTGLELLKDELLAKTGEDRA